LATLVTMTNEPNGLVRCASRREDLVVDDLGRLGRVWREADYEASDFETIVKVSPARSPFGARLVRGVDKTGWPA
jgi:hypothetical protein